MTAPLLVLEEPVAPSHAVVVRHVGWWAMALVCATEACFFAALLGMWFYLAARNQHWPPTRIGRPSLLLPSIMTAALAGSSVTLHWAGHEPALGRQRRLQAGLAVTAALGLLFLLLQGYEYREKLGKFLPQSDAYGSAFFTVTGFHGLHVLLGLLMLLYTLARASNGHFAGGSGEGVRVVSLYWHFVDGVWLVLFAVIYLLPWLRP